jgi:hypothetical protein
MILIDILNPEEIVENEAGKFQIIVAKTLGIDLKRRIEGEMAKRLKEEMTQNGLIVEVRTVD